MEVKINREIRSYTESMFFGLSMRQFVFSILACAVAVGLYFCFGLMWEWKPCPDVYSGRGSLRGAGLYQLSRYDSGAVFVGMARSELLEPKRLYCVPTNYYYEALKNIIAAHEKGMLKPDAAVCKRRCRKPMLKTLSNLRKQDKENIKRRAGCRMSSRSGAFGRTVFFRWAASSAIPGNSPTSTIRCSLEDKR